MLANYFHFSETTCASEAAAWRHWLRRGWPLWVSLVLVIGGVRWWELSNHTQDTVRQIGLVYELLGVSVVLVEILRVMRKHDLPWPHKRLSRYFRDMPPLRKVESLRGSMTTSTSLTAHIDEPVIHTVSPGMPLESRLANAEQNIALLAQRVSTLKASLADARTARMAEMAAEGQQRTGALGQLNDAIKSLEVGSLNLSLFGLWWLLAGMVLTTGTPEACALLSNCRR